MNEPSRERKTLPPIREMFPDFDSLMSSQPSSPAASSRRWSATSSAPSPSRVYALRGAGDDAHALSPVRPPSASQSDQSRCSSPGLTHSMPVFSVMAMSTGGLNTVQSAPATPLSRSSLRMLTDRAPSRMHNSASSLYQLAGLQRQPNIGPVVSPDSSKRYHCPRCARAFSTQSNVWRHRRTAHPEEDIPLRSMRGRSHT